MIETALAKEYLKQEIRTPIHLSIGQEISASSICNLLEKNDYERKDVQEKIVILYGAFQDVRVAPQNNAQDTRNLRGRRTATRS